MGLMSTNEFYFKNNIKQENKPISLSEYNKQIANKKKLVLVYFSADWCTVCAKMKPLIEEIEKRDSLNVNIIKIDTDRDKEVAHKYEIDAMPVLMLYKDGCREWMNIGLIDKQELRYTIDFFLKKK